MSDYFSYFNFIMSIITGVISGLIATEIYYLLGRKNRFIDDKQTYVHYVLLVKEALTEAYLEKNISVLQIILEDQPILKNIYKRSLKRKFGKHENNDAKSILSDIENCLRELSNDVRANTLFKKNEIQYQRKLSLPMKKLLSLKY